MIDKTKYPKTAEDFDKWLGRTFWRFPRVCSVRRMELNIPEEMQTGIYLRCFDECGIYIDICKSIGLDKWEIDVWYDDVIESGHTQLYDSRIRALKSAIQKASEIREKQLLQ